MANPTHALVAGRYELGGLLGGGSMGVVREARDLVLDRPVAVKLFRRDGGDLQQAQRYEQEARLLASLTHPGLVTVYDAGVDATLDDDPQPYLVMELVRGQTLADRIGAGVLSESEVASIGAQLATALGYIHRQGVVHRDVKPANILLAETDAGTHDAEHPVTAKLTDFGIARLIDGARMTMTGMTVGTANYLSPEQLRGAGAEAPSDIYSLGLVLLECLTGQVAYPGHGAEAAMARLQYPPGGLDAVPEGWARLLRAMTDMDPQARPRAGEVAIAVTGLAAPPEHEQLPQTQVLPTVALPAIDEPATDGWQPAGPVARRRRRLPWAWIAAAVALVLVIAGIALAVGSGGSSEPSPPAYPAVAGALGTHLRQLERDLPPDPVLQADVLVLGRTANRGDVAAATLALGQLRAHIAEELATGALDAGRGATLRADAAVIARDLAALAGPTHAPTQTTQASQTTHAAPPPGPQPKPKKDHHGKGGHGGDG